MTIKLINGIPTRMLEDVEKRIGKVLKKVEEGENYFVYISNPSDDGQFGDFEVFLKKYEPKSILDSHTEYEQIEHYPATSEWGKIAWSFRKRTNVDKQIKKFLSKKV